MTIPSHQTHFRPDLQILRAIAVILVFLFHLDIAVFQGGFIGVDIFFVLSGFFMAQTLRELNKDKILSFFDRRIRRILPLPLIIFLLLMIVAPFLFLPHELILLNKNFLGSLFLVPNILYWNDNNYFQEHLFRPMLHYWSLGVEYHYYLFFPLILFIFKKIKYTDFLLFSGSLLLCIGMTMISPKTAFFLLPTRVWQFLAGYFLFKFASQRADIPATVKALCWGAAAILIAISTCFFNGDSPFPGALAILPTLAAALIIYARTDIPQDKFGWLVRPLVFLGTISFSVYILHYPIIFAFKYGPFGDWQALSHLDRIIIAAITLPLSYLTYKTIENYFRSPRKISGTKFYGFLGIVFVASLSMSAVTVKTNYFSFMYPPELRDVFASMEDRMPYRCGKIKRLFEPFNTTCAFRDMPNASKNVLLYGDSHADALKPPFISLAEDYDVNLYLNKYNCKPGVGRCTFESMWQAIEDRGVTDIVLYNLTSVGQDFTPFDRLIEKAQGQNIQIHIIEPTPLYAESIPEFLYRKYQNGLDVPAPEQKFVRSDVFYEYKSGLDTIPPYVHFYDPKEYLCQPQCSIADGYKAYYHDAHHLTVRGANLLTPIVSQIYSHQ